MRFDFFLLADSVEVGEAGKLTIRGAEVTRLSGTELPVTAGRLSAVAVFLIDSEDVGTEPTIRVKGWSPDGTVLFQTPTMVLSAEALSQDDLSEGEEPRLSFVVELDGLQFKMTGAHRMEVELNDEKVGSRSLAVVIEPAPEDEPVGEAEKQFR